MAPCNEPGTALGLRMALKPSTLFFPPFLLSSHVLPRSDEVRLATFAFCSGQAGSTEIGVRSF